MTNNFKIQKTNKKQNKIMNNNTTVYSNEYLDNILDNMFSLNKSKRFNPKYR